MATWRNRHGEFIQFTDMYDTVEMRDYFQGGIRLSGEEIDGKIPDPLWIDISGGPMIHKGDNLEFVFKDGIPRIVKKIEFGEQCITFTLKKQKNGTEIK